MSESYEVGTRAWQPDAVEGWVPSEVEQKIVEGDKVRLVFRLENGEVSFPSFYLLGIDAPLNPGVEMQFRSVGGYLDGARPQTAIEIAKCLQSCCTFYKSVFVSALAVALFSVGSRWPGEKEHHRQHVLCFQADTLSFILAIRRWLLCYFQYRISICYLGHQQVTSRTSQSELYAVELH
jgi:hypothetical protein